MSPFPASHDEPDLVVLATLLELAREIHGEVVQISDDTWAIHGHVPYDGDIIVAEFHERAVAAELLRLIPSEPINVRAGASPTAQPPETIDLTDPVTIDLRQPLGPYPTDWEPNRGNPLPARHRGGATLDASMAPMDHVASTVIDRSEWETFTGNPLPRRRPIG